MIAFTKDPDLLVLDLFKIFCKFTPLTNEENYQAYFYIYQSVLLLLQEEDRGGQQTKAINRIKQTLKRYLLLYLKSYILNLLTHNPRKNTLIDLGHFFNIQASYFFNYHFFVSGNSTEYVSRNFCISEMRKY